MKKILLVLVLATLPLLTAQTIAEKKAGLKRSFSDLDPKTERSLIKVNEELTLMQARLNDLYAEARLLHQAGGSEEEFQVLLEQINVQRNEIRIVAEEWQRSSPENMKSDIYALWHQPETSLEQLVIDFGSQDYVYLMSPQIAEMRLSVNSNIPIPRAAWQGMLEQILTQNGVGIRQLNPFLRELYLIGGNPGPVNIITNQADELEFLPESERVAFLLSPGPTEVRRVLAFLEKFVNPQTTTIDQLGRQILLVSTAAELRDLLKLYDFAADNTAQQTYKLVPLRRIPAKEMARVVSAMFDQLAEDPVFVSEDKSDLKRSRDELTDVGGLRIIVLDSLSQAVFLVGSQDEISQAERLIRKVDSSIAGGRQRVIHWYVAHYSNTEDLAATMQQIYNAMLTTSFKTSEITADVSGDINTNVDQNVNVEERTPNDWGPMSYNSYYVNQESAIGPSAFDSTDYTSRKDGVKHPNFIVDEKTSSLVMVIEAEYLDRLLEIASKLDQPKKMVQIDVLVFERGCREQTNWGLNLLKIGGCAENIRNTALCWTDPITSTLPGILEFFIQRPKQDGWPAFDLGYQFLFSSEQLTLNANPSITTLNQTKARVSIRDEISINTGTDFFQTTNSTIPRNSFAREQYGITIDVTPTIHLWDPSQEYGDATDFVTLETQINFDTINPNSAAADRPEVNRREIINQVIVPDGQTIVIGGLRRKETNDSRDSVPFIGEIPGFGKLFGTNKMEDRTTELIVFLTPRIIKDPCEDIEKLKMEKLSKRPGDLPCFMWRFNESRNCQYRQAFSHTVKILCGRKQCYYPTQTGCINAALTHPSVSVGEYDGR